MQLFIRVGMLIKISSTNFATYHRDIYTSLFPTNPDSKHRPIVGHQKPWDGGVLKGKLDPSVKPQDWYHVELHVEIHYFNGLYT